jgi:hypothetical protein
MSSNTTDLGDALRYASETFGCHEASHIRHVIAVMMPERKLAEHPVMVAEPDCEALVDGTMEVLGEVCHALGVQHL